MGGDQLPDDAQPESRATGVAVTGIVSGWSYWVVGGALVVAVWLSTRLALRAARVRSSNRIDSRRR